MVYIFKDRLIRVEWTIYKGISPVKEDFSRSNVKVFLLGNREKYLLQARADKGTLYVDIPSGLEEGTYSIEAIWVKNMDHVFDTRSVCRSKKEDLFSITEFEDEATNIGEGVVVLKVKTSTATYGYDGLSSYELAVLRGDWNGTEGEWLKHERYVSVLDSRGDSEVDTMSQKAITDELETQDNAIEDIREDTGKLGERVEEAEEKVNNMGDVVDEIKSHAPVSARPAGFKPDIDLTPEITVDRAWRDHEGNVIRDTYITRRGLRNEIIDITNQQVTDLKPGSVDPDDLSEATKQLIGNKSITNLPDEEDITVTDNQTLKLKDKEYAPKDYSGMGRVYLRKHYVNGVNTLTQHMMRKPNTIYIIQYDYCLAGQTIEVPENCVLQFEGGSLRNGIVRGNDTQIVVNVGKVIFDSVNFDGRFVNSILRTSYFGLVSDLHTVEEFWTYKKMNIPIEVYTGTDNKYRWDCVWSIINNSFGIELNIDGEYYVNSNWKTLVIKNASFLKIHGGTVDIAFYFRGCHDVELYDITFVGLHKPHAMPMECVKEENISDTIFNVNEGVSNLGYTNEAIAIQTLVNGEDVYSYGFNIHDCKVYMRSNAFFIGTNRPNTDTIKDVIIRDCFSDSIYWQTLSLHCSDTIVDNIITYNNSESVDISSGCHNVSISNCKCYSDNCGPKQDSKIEAIEITRNNELRDSYFNITYNKYIDATAFMLYGVGGYRFRF
ncbi:hypothetical protein NXW63_01405 [Parabacteroides distasonis]|nr:hypothetical protein [Parabacteroides distasonis]